LFCLKFWISLYFFNIDLLFFRRLFYFLNYWFVFANFVYFLLLNLNKFIVVDRFIVKFNWIPFLRWLVRAIKVNFFVRMLFNDIWLTMKRIFSNLYIVKWWTFRFWVFEDLWLAQIKLNRFELITVNDNLLEFEIEVPFLFVLFIFMEIMAKILCF
jgi:hypothetical protein